MWVQEGRSGIPVNPPAIYFCISLRARDDVVQSAKMITVSLKLVGHFHVHSLGKVLLQTLLCWLSSNSVRRNPDISSLPETSRDLLLLGSPKKANPLPECAAIAIYAPSHQISMYLPRWDRCNVGMGSFLEISFAAFILRQQNGGAQSSQRTLLCSQVRWRITES